MAFRTRTTKSRRGGFTLAESLIASAILAVAVTGIVGPITASYRQMAVSNQLTQAASLARELLSEVESKPFADPTDRSLTLGPEVGESSRDQFDNIDDYNGYHDNTSELKMLNGTDVGWNGKGVYQRSVKVEYRTTPSGTAAPSGSFAMVTVTITMPSGQSYVVQRLFANYPKGN
jgi:prepilin-type N-terminal cleavage/methylation domain-containing protein